MRRRVIPLILIFALFMLLPMTVQAGSSVSYEGGAEEFVFLPQDDLFENFKGVMPGDVLTQTVEVRNSANKVNVSIYMRAAGAEDNVDFLKQLNLQVASEETGTLFDGSADSSDGLEDWVCLGTFSPGSKTQLELTLTVPLELDNSYQNAQGTVVWEFRAEEKPIAAAPQTGDTTPVLLLGAILLLSAVGMTTLMITRRKQY